MAKTARPHKYGVRLSDAEKWYCEKLCEEDGVDISGQFRRCMLKEARERGLVYPGTEAPPKAKKSRKNH